MKIKVYNSRGEAQYIPEHWVDHPVLSKGFTLKPPVKTEPETKPAATTTRKVKNNA